MIRAGVLSVIVFVCILVISAVAYNIMNTTTNPAPAVSVHGDQELVTALNVLQQRERTLWREMEQLKDGMDKKDCVTKSEREALAHARDKWCDTHGAMTALKEILPR